MVGQAAQVSTYLHAGHAQATCLTSAETSTGIAKPMSAISELADIILTEKGRRRVGNLSLVCPLRNWLLVPPPPPHPESLKGGHPHVC